MVAGGAQLLLALLVGVAEEAARARLFALRAPPVELGVGPDVVAGGAQLLLALLVGVAEEAARARLVASHAASHVRGDQPLAQCLRCHREAVDRLLDPLGTPLGPPQATLEARLSVGGAAYQLREVRITLNDR